MRAVEASTDEPPNRRRTMRKLVFLASILAAMSFGAAQSDAQDAMVKGEITKIDEAQAKLTIKHEPIKKFDMDAMTMVFKAADPAMLKAVKAGDKVQFNLDKVNGQFTVTKIEKTK
jgi:Cu(I)/Ag(I) efflux system periplasmic protein CusF